MEVVAQEEASDQPNPAGPGDQGRMKIRAAIWRTLIIALLGCSQIVMHPTTAANIAACQNEEIALSPTVIVISPHPDDEILGFGGLIHEALRAGRRVRVVIVTDGQRFCEACAFWKAGRPFEEQCTNDELEAFGEARREESLTALRILGLEAAATTFLGYYDSTLAPAWRDQRSAPVPTACEAANVNALPKRVKTGHELVQELVGLFESEPSAHSIFTTHPLDRHPDHAALYRFVLKASAALGRPMDVYASVLHSHSGTDCNYPLPQSVTDTCSGAEVAFASPTLTNRYRPSDTWSPPTDADYGRPLMFCLDSQMYDGLRPLKRTAVDAFQTQLGMARRKVGLLDKRFVGWTDRAGYLFSFVRRNEVFYLNPPVPMF